MKNIGRTICVLFNHFLPFNQRCEALWRFNTTTLSKNSFRETNLNAKVELFLLVIIYLVEAIFAFFFVASCSSSIKSSNDGSTKCSFSVFLKRLAK